MRHTIYRSTSSWEGKWLYLPINLKVHLMTCICFFDIFGKRTEIFREKFINHIISLCLAFKWKHLCKWWILVVVVWTAYIHHKCQFQQTHTQRSSSYIVKAFDSKASSSLNESICITNWMIHRQYTAIIIVHVLVHIVNTRIIEFNDFKNKTIFLIVFRTVHAHCNLIKFSQILCKHCTFTLVLW